MKNYIGVKIVKAEPQEKDGRPGYKVVYPDGYVSDRKSTRLNSSHIH